LRHREFVSAAAFSPDGWTLLTGSGDNAAYLWSLRANLDPLDRWENLRACSPYYLSENGALAENPTPADACQR
jgi:WD40 repeat protein